MQKTCHEVLDAVGHGDDPILKVALELERIALSDDYFIQKKLYPNIDFYSGITLKALGFPTDMFTVLFAIARTVGWIAQWKEMIEDPSQRIGRPRQLYTGATERSLRADGRGARRRSSSVGKLDRPGRAKPVGGRDGGGVLGHQTRLRRPLCRQGRRLPRCLTVSAPMVGRSTRLFLSGLRRLDQDPASGALLGPADFA